MFSHSKGRHALAAALLVALGASLLATSPAGAQEEPPPTSEAPPEHALDRAYNGQGAINALGDRLPEVAAAHDMRPDELARTFREDLTLWVDPTLRLFYVEPTVEEHNQGLDDPDGELPGIEGSAPYPLDQTFLLESRPGSNRTIYLDFDGDEITNTGWNNSPPPPNGYDTGATIVADSYDLDSDPSTFSDTERENIQDIWRRVSEDYAPFDVNVTTQDPGYAAINRSSAGDTAYGTRVLVDGGTPALDCGCGGIAYVGTFDYWSSTTKNHDFYQPAWVFQEGTGSPKSIAEAASHEAGHNLNLHHDGLGAGGGSSGSGNDDYYTGHGAWAPIMGVGYYKPVVQWSKGEYPNASNDASAGGEDDLAVMQASGIPVMADDHGDTPDGTATALTPDGPIQTGSGLISTAADSDVFSFTSDGDLMIIQANPADVSPNLDISLALYDSLGALIDSADPVSAFSSDDAATGLAAEVAQPLAAGTYYVRVDGAGAAPGSDPGYSDYGSLGHYDLTVASGPCALGDPDEDDDDATSARLLIGGQSASGTRCPGDDDWFLVPGINGATLTVDLAATDAGGDLDLEILDASLAQAALATTTGGTEQIVHTFSANEDHYVRVHSTTDSETRYDLTTAFSGCPPDDQWEEDDFLSVTTPLTLPAAKDGVSCTSDTNAADYASFSAIAGEEVQIELYYPQSVGSLTLFLFAWNPGEGSASSIASGALGVDKRTITYTPTVDDDFQIKVGNVSGAVPYRLKVSQPGATPPDAAPTVSLDSPAEGATVRGIVQLTATATDDLGVDQVEFKIDGVSVGLGTPGAGDTWYLTWNSAGVGDGQSHVITAVATDTGTQTVSEMSNATVLSNAVADFDGDGVTDVAVFRPSTGRWYMRGVGQAQYGESGDIPVPGDYDGDGVMDVAVFRPSTSRWYVQGVLSLVYGESGDIPINPGMARIP